MMKEDEQKTGGTTMKGDVKKKGQNRNERRKKTGKIQPKTW